MSSGLFVRMGHRTRKLVLDLIEELDADNVAVWRAEIDGEQRFVETDLDAEIWHVIDKAVHAYEEER